MQKKKENLRVSDLMRLGTWETLTVDKSLNIRRVYGGFIYEYLSKEKEVTAAVFISTDEFRNM